MLLIKSMCETFCADAAELEPKTEHKASVWSVFGAASVHADTGAGGSGWQVQPRPAGCLVHKYQSVDSNVSQLEANASVRDLQVV